MLTHKPIIANAFLGGYRYHSRGTIHPHAKAVGLSLPLDPTAVTFDIAEFNNQMVQMGWAGPAIAAAGIFIALMQGRKKAA